MAATKKPRRWQGRERRSGLQSGLGWGAQRSGNALAEAAAPAEGSASTEDRKGAGHCGGRRRWRPDHDLNGVVGGIRIRAVLWLQCPSPEQACGGEAKSRKSFGVKSGCGSDWGAGCVASSNAKFWQVSPEECRNTGHAIGGININSAVERCWSLCFVLIEISFGARAENGKCGIN